MASGTFPIEHIPDNDHLLRRVLQKQFSLLISFSSDKNYIPPKVFQTKDKDISVNWEKYSSINHTLTTNARKPPNNYIILQLVTGMARLIEKVAVTHDPLLTNRSHSLMLVRPKSMSRSEFDIVRLRLSKICKKVHP